jgi:polyisoprenoid-binding protein YceI
MKVVVVGMLAFVLPGVLLAQTKFIDRNGKASFFSSAPMENIEAHNSHVVSIIDTDSGEIGVSMLMRSFNFKKALMEEHFNETYVESSKYPKASFKGKVTNLADLDLSKNGKQTLEISGEITLHGVTQPLTVKAETIVENGTLHAKAVFPLVVEDFKIEIPKLVRDNIAKKVEVTVSFNYQPMKI